ncbi:hypothetical protein AAIO74_06780 [Escherichia coli]|uniref:hypothetical protein n=1 Tax=Escherichia coli TaxID=562 RepID=UPI003D7B3F40
MKLTLLWRKCFGVFDHNPEERIKIKKEKTKTRKRREPEREEKEKKKIKNKIRKNTSIFACFSGGAQVFSSDHAINL